MKPTRMIAGICAPTADAVGPTAAVNVYAGAMHEMPMTTAPMRPIVPALRPLLERPRSRRRRRSRRGAHRRSPRWVRGTTITGTVIS
jgi:hypothetical protein